MNKCIFYFLWVLVGLAISVGFLINKVSGITIQEPALEKVVNWQVNKSLGLVFMYLIDGKEILFAHPIKSQGQHQECQELQFKPKYNEIQVIVGGVAPWMYLVTGEPTMYRFKESAEWKGIGTMRKTIWQKPYQYIGKE